MTPFTTPERHFELLKDGEGERALVVVRLPTGNGAFEVAGKWNPALGLYLNPKWLLFDDDVIRLAALCAHEFVKG